MHWLRLPVWTLVRLVYSDCCCQMEGEIRIAVKTYKLFLVFVSSLFVLLLIMSVLNGMKRNKIKLQRQDTHYRFPFRLCAFLRIQKKNHAKTHRIIWFFLCLLNTFQLQLLVSRNGSCCFECVAAILYSIMICRSVDNVWVLFRKWQRALKQLNAENWVLNAGIEQCTTLHSAHTSTYNPKLSARRVLWIHSFSFHLLIRTHAQFVSARSFVRYYVSQWKNALTVLLLPHTVLCAKVSYIGNR